MVVKKNVFLIAGHGSEELVDFTKRFKVPEDKVIVTFPICGRVNFMHTCCRIAHMFNMKEHVELLSNPIANKKEIEKLFRLDTPMRIYLPNDHLPQLSTNLFLDFDFEKDGMVLMKSGVYRINKIPEINREVLPPIKTVDQKLGSTFCNPFIGLANEPSDYTPTVHKELYKGNVYKPALTTGNRLEDYQLNRDFMLKDIITTVGKGIYYYIGCRSLNPNYDLSIYDNIFDISSSQQAKSNRSKKIDTVIPLLESISVSKKKTPPDDPKSKKKEIIVKQRRTLNRRIRPPLKK